MTSQFKIVITTTRFQVYNNIVIDAVVIDDSVTKFIVIRVLYILSFTVSSDA